MARVEVWTSGDGFRQGEDTQVPVEQVNAAVIRRRASAALTTNATFLAIASPSTAQVATQVKALTRQCDGVIRLLLAQLDDTTGT